MNVSTLADRHKAALVILSLDESVAEEVMRSMDEADLVRLARAVDELDPIPQEALIPALEEFERKLSEPMLAGRGNAYIRRLAESAIGKDRAIKLFDPDDTPPAISAIRGARASTLAELLQEEHPQIAAVIISQLPSVQAGRVVRAMREDRQADLVARIARLDEVPAEALTVASEALVVALAAAGGMADRREGREFDGVAFTAALLNELPTDDTDRLLERLEEVEAEVVPKIRDAMFTFEDLVRLDQRGLQTLMREIQADQLLVALKTASETLREKFFGSVSSRAAATMREDLELMPPKRLSDVEAAQREVVECAMRLASEARLVMPGGANEELV